MALTAATAFRDYETDGVPSSGAHKIKKPDMRSWGAWVEGIINAFTANGGLVYTTKAAMDADLAHGANSSAWVIGDATVANNGIYRKIGASGVGSWTRVSDLPFSFIIASDAGAGTANAIQATTSIPVSSSALVWMNIFEANTASPVTVSFNGDAALTIKTNSGNDVTAGGLTAGMIVMGIVSGSSFRLVSDQASSAIVAAAEAAQASAEDAQAAAESAETAAEAAQAAAEAAAAGVDLPPVAPDRMLVDNDAGTERESKTFDEVRQLLGLGDFGHPVVDLIPNYDPSASATRTIIEGNTENGGSPIYHRHFGTVERDNIGRLHVIYRRALGHATYFEGGIYGVYLEHNGQQRSAESEIVAPVAGYDISAPRLVLLPNGNMLLVWEEMPITSPGVVGTPIVFKAKLSRDNGDTWGVAYTIFTCNFSYCRMFGDIKIINDYGAGGRFRLALTAYYRVSTAPDVLHTAVFYSEDEGETWVEGSPIYSGTIQYNETAVAWVGTSVAIAVMRVNPADGFYISRTTDGGTTWSAPVKLTAIEATAVAPSLDVVTHNGVPYLLLGYCDRSGSPVTKWRWDTAARCLSTADAFTGNVRTTSATDMIKASGYQATRIFPSGQMLFVEFKEYSYSVNTDPVGTDVRLVYANPASWIAGEEQSFTPTLAGATTPGTPVGSFTGTIIKTACGHVTGTLRIALTSKGGMVGQLKIGLPYANKTGTRYRAGGNINFFSNVTLPNGGEPRAIMLSASSTLDLWRTNASGGNTIGLANLDSADVSDTFVIEVWFEYFTDQ